MDREDEKEEEIVEVEKYEGTSWDIVGHGCALVETTLFDRRVVRSNPALAAM